MELDEDGVIGSVEPFIAALKGHQGKARGQGQGQGQGGGWGDG